MASFFYLDAVTEGISDNVVGKICIKTLRLFVYSKLGLLEIMIHSIKLSV